MKMRSWLWWALLLTHVVLLGVSGFGLWTAVDNFGNHKEWGPPSPPPRRNTTTTTTTAKPYWVYDRHSDRHEKDLYEETAEYRAYVSKMDDYANILAEPRLYLACSCSLVGLTSILTIIAGLFSSRIFTTTVGLYSSVMVWVSTLLSGIGYQSYFYFGDQFLPTGMWVVGVLSALLLILSVQVVMLMWELRRQKTCWPTFHIVLLFSCEFILLIIRLVLAGFIIAILFDSELIYGLPSSKYIYYDWNGPRHRYQLWLSVSAVIAAFYNIMSTIEITLSTLIGTPHQQMTWITTLITVFGNGWLAILSSPVFMPMPFRWYLKEQTLLILSTAASVTAFIHTMAYWLCPDFLRTAPSIVRLVSVKVYDAGIHLLDALKGISFDSILSLAGDIKREASQLASKKPVSHEAAAYHFISFFVSLLILFILFTVWDAPIWMSWGAAVFVGVNMAGVIHSLPPIIIHFCFFRTIELDSFDERAIRAIIELAIVLVGSIAVFVKTWDVGLKVLACINLTCVLLKIVLLVKEQKDHKKAQGNGASTTSTSQLLEEQETEDKKEKEETLMHDKEPVSMA